jgi:hypothetical protein
MVRRPTVDTYRSVCEGAGNTGDNEALFKRIGDEKQKRAFEGTMTESHIQVLASCDRVVHYCLCGGACGFLHSPAWLLLRLFVMT